MDILDFVEQELPGFDPEKTLKDNGGDSLTRAIIYVNVEDAVGVNIPADWFTDFPIRTWATRVAVLVKNNEFIARYGQTGHQATREY